MNKQLSTTHRLLSEISTLIEQARQQLQQLSKELTAKFGKELATL